MTALKGRAIKAFLAEPDPDCAAILVYGPDAGLVRERGERLARMKVSDLKDPFNALELADADLKEEPGRLADEIAALSFAGGERAIRLRTIGEASAKPAEILIKGLENGTVKPNGVVIIEAGDLGPRSGLRKLFEKSGAAIALPCYQDNPADVRDMAREAAHAEDLRFEDDALDLTVSLLGEDHGVSRAEIEKLVLFKGPKRLRGGRDVISIADVRAVLVDGLGRAIDEAASAATDGAPRQLSAALYKAQAAGASPISLLIAFQRAVSRLGAARRLIDEGMSPADAMKKLRPPVFFPEQRAFERRLDRWSSARLDTVARLLVEAEIDAKSAGAPQREIIERAALRMSMMAR